MNRLKSKFADKNKGEEFVANLRPYPLGLLLFQTPLSILRLLQVAKVNTKSSWYWYEILASTLSNCLGMFNSCVYGLNPRVKTTICKRRAYSDVGTLIGTAPKKIFLDEISES